MKHVESSKPMYERVMNYKFRHEKIVKISNNICYVYDGHILLAKFKVK